MRIRTLTNIQIDMGDITTFHGDAIVNAANPALSPGAGVCGAIFRKAGIATLHDSIKTMYPRGCHTGDAVLTLGYDLNARFIVHAVGPVWHGGHRAEEELLASAYQRSLEVACENKCRTIAFPAISTGVYGFPADRAAYIAVKVVLEFLVEHPHMEVWLIAFDRETYERYDRLLDAEYEAVYKQDDRIVYSCFRDPTHARNGQKARVLAYDPIPSPERPHLIQFEDGMRLFAERRDLHPDPDAEMADDDSLNATINEVETFFVPQPEPGEEWPEGEQGVSVAPMTLADVETESVTLRITEPKIAVPSKLEFAQWDTVNYNSDDPEEKYNGTTVQILRVDTTDERYPYFVRFEDGYETWVPADFLAARTEEQVEVEPAYQPKTAVFNQPDNLWDRNGTTVTVERADGQGNSQIRFPDNIVKWVPTSYLTLHSEVRAPSTFNPANLPEGWDLVAIKVKEIVVSELGGDASRVTPDARFVEDLKADSLDTVELVMAFEESFGGLEIPDEDAEKLHTVGDVVTYLCGRPEAMVQATGIAPESGTD